MLFCLYFIIFTVFLYFSLFPLGFFADIYNMLDFWIRVKNRIKETGSTQDSVAAAIQERADNFSRWIQKDRLPDAEQTYKIASVLGVSVEYLVTGETSDPSDKIAKIKNDLLGVIRDLENIKS